MSKLLIDRKTVEQALDAIKCSMDYRMGDPSYEHLGARLVAALIPGMYKDPAKFKLGDTVRKIKGSQWHGKIVGTYSTTLTPEGYCVESKYEAGSVQIYPASALELDK